MTADTSNRAGLTAGSAAGVVAGIPPIIAAALVELALAEQVPQPVSSAMSSSAGLVVGAWMLRRSQQRDVRRPRPARAGALPASTSISSRTLLVVICGFTFSLLDLLASLAGYGTLFYTSPQAVYDSVQSLEGSDAAYNLAAPRAMVLSFAAMIPVAVWFAHRLRSSARTGLYIALAMDVVGSLAITLHMERRMGREWVTGQDLLWLLAGAAVGLVACRIAASLAARDQHRFDAGEAARQQLP